MYNFCMSSGSMRRFGESIPITRSNRTSQRQLLGEKQPGKNRRAKKRKTMLDALERVTAQLWSFSHRKYLSFNSDFTG